MPEPDGFRELYHDGRYREIVEAFKAKPADFRGHPHSLLLASETLAWAGDMKAANSLIESPELAAESFSPKREYIRAIIEKEGGRSAAAIAHLECSIRTANGRPHLEQRALSCLLLLRLVSEYEPPEVVQQALAEARSCVTKTGVPWLSAFLHESVARFESQAGRFDEAERHLRAAEAILERHPHAWVKQLCAIGRFCLYWLTGDLHGAATALGFARQLCKQTGSMEAVILNNEAHLHLRSGQFDEATKKLARVVATADGLTRLGGLEGQARLALHVGDFEQCETALNALGPHQTPDGLSRSFALRWALVTKLRLYLLQGRFEEALAVSAETVRVGERVKDQQIVGVAMALRAYALDRSGQKRESVEAIVEALAYAPDRQLEHQQAILHAFGELALATDAELSRSLLQRANSAGDVGRGMSGAHAAPRQPSASGRTDAAGAYGVLDGLVATAESAHDPARIGARTASLIEAIGCSSGTRLERRRGDRLGPPRHACILDLGAKSGYHYSLHCETPNTAAQALALDSVFRLVRSALALEKFRQEERRRAALWPADSIETEAGALFLAEEMQALLATARRIAPATVPILITGETGTGKEVLARLIHAYSPRAKASFLPFNCTAVPRDMLDAQLFGHRRGAFTGAVDNFQGVIRAAAGGTLFLDEIGESTLDIQPKLLRFLDASEIHPIGELAPVAVDVRVIAATNADLDGLVAAGRFREDLLYRLNTVRLHLPPLRERRVEIPALANHYLRKHARENHKGDLRLAEETMDYLVLYRWPGNVRQLANEMRRVAALAEPGAVVMPEDLSPEIAASRRTVPPSERPLDANEIAVRLDQPMPAGVQYLERRMIEYRMKQPNVSLEDLAAQLGLSRKGLYLKRQRYGLIAPGEETDVA